MCLGHEMAGTVDWVGDRGRRARASATGSWCIPGDDELGRIGNGGAQGGLTPLLLVTRRRPRTGCMRCPTRMPLDVAAFAEPLAVGMHAADQADVRPGDGVCVLGCGPIGLAAIATLVDRGHDRVVAVDLDPDPARRSPSASVPRPRSIRSPTTCGPRSPTSTAPRRSCSGRPPATAAFIEATGADRVIGDVIDHARVGATLAVVALHYAPVPTSFLMILMKELTIRGSIEYPPRFDDAIDLLVRRDLSALLTHRFPLDRFPDALDVLQESKDCGKVLVTMDDRSR